MKARLGPVRDLKRGFKRVWAEEANNVSRFMELVAEITASWFKDDAFGPWFRGHQRGHWQLCPKLYRDYGGYAGVRERHIEDEVREEFMVRAPTLSESRVAGADEWEWYFLMQHFGTPTRLLDWTEGAMLALYFAVRDNPGSYESAVWVLDAFALNERAIKTEQVIPPSAAGIRPKERKLVDPWLPARVANLARLPRKPIAVLPTHVARRISTQRSCFTVHGSDVSGLDRLVRIKDSPLRKIVIPRFCAVGIRLELEANGIDETTIYPDLDGLSRSLCVKWLARQIVPHNAVFTRLRPSRVHKGGVGVFAIRPIKKGTALFANDSDEMVWVSEDSLPTRKPLRELYNDFSVISKERRYGCPPSFNRLTMSWYLNEPTKGESPNVTCDPGTFDFFALRNIKTGEELTVDYSQYSGRPVQRQH
jgi:hypothetical protein